MANLQWHDVQANFNDANSLFSTGIQSISKVGDVFSKMRDRQLEQEKLDREMAYKELALEEEIAHHIAQEDLEDARLGENQYQYDTTFKFNKEKDERDYLLNEKKFNEGIRQFNVGVDENRRKAILDATVKMFSGDKKDEAEKLFLKAALGLGIGSGRSNGSSGSGGNSNGIIYGGWDNSPSIDNPEFQHDMLELAKAQQRQAEREHAIRKNEEVNRRMNMLMGALTASGIPFDEAAMKKLRQSSLVSVPEEYKPQPYKVEPSAPEIPQTSETPLAQTQNTTLEPGTILENGMGKTPSGAEVRNNEVVEQPINTEKYKPTSFAQRLHTSLKDQYNGTPTIGVPASETSRVMRMKQDDMNNTINSAVLNLSSLMKMSEEQLQVLASTPDVAKRIQILRNLKVNPDQFAENEIRNFAKALNDAFVKTDKNWTKSSEAEKAKIIAEHLYKIDLSHIDTDDITSVYHGLANAIANAAQFRYMPITDKATGRRYLMDTEGIKTYPDMPELAKERMKKEEKLQTSSRDTTQIEWDEVFGTLNGSGHARPDSPYAATGRVVMRNISPEAKKNTVVRNSKDLGDLIEETTGFRFLDQSDKRAIRKMFGSIFSDLELNISPNDSDAVKAYKMKAQTGIFNEFINGLEPNFSDWTRGGAGVLNIWGSDFATDTIYKHLMNGNTAKAIINGTNNTKIRDNVAFTLKRINDNDGFFDFREYHESSKYNKDKVKESSQKRKELGIETVNGESLTSDEIKIITDTSQELKEERDKLLYKKVMGNNIPSGMSADEAILRARIKVFTKAFEQEAKTAQDKENAPKKAMELARKLFLESDENRDKQSRLKWREQILSPKK